MLVRTLCYFYVGLVWVGLQTNMATAQQGPTQTEQASNLQVQNPSLESQELSASVDRWHLLNPPWSSEVIHGESVCLMQYAPGSPLIGRLAFPIEEILEVRCSDRSALFTSEDGLSIAAEQGLITLPADSQAPFVRVDQFFPPIDSPNSYKSRLNHPDQALLYGPHQWFHQHQIEVTYRKREQEWHSDVPQLASLELPKTLERLQNKQTLRVGISGDSIAAGGDASGLNDIEPRQPAFPELVVEQMRASYGTEVELNNRAVGGWSIANGLQDLSELLKGHPHLIVMAYGMNDVGRRDPAWFREQVSAFLAAVRNEDPTIEVLMVTPMLGHAEWIHTPRDMFFKYRDELKAMVGPGVALADVTSVWNELLTRKHDLDLTGNGLNHPNDYGHRLYAQVILALLCKQE